MKTVGNIFWFIFGGFGLSISWFFTGLFWCITIIGIPVGVQCFKIAGLALWPFGKEIEYGGGVGSFLFNIIWLIVSGFALAIGHIMIGLMFCITIVGIPFGMQCFKLAKLCLMPMGAVIKS